MLYVGTSCSQQMLPATSKDTLREYYTPNQQLTCFVLYLEIINTFLKYNIYASYSKLSKEL